MVEVLRRIVWIVMAAFGLCIVWLGVVWTLIGPAQSGDIDGPYSAPDRLAMAAASAAVFVIGGALFVLPVRRVLRVRDRV
jgi:hypothetical protein